MTKVTTNDKLDVPQHRLRNGLESGQLMLGTFSSLATSWAARVVATCGWDYVIIDQEHGNHDDGDMHETVNAVAFSGVSPIVRIRAAEYGLIKRALDCGAHGIMVPMVNTAETARDIIQWSKFPPMGARGQGSSFSAMASGLSLPEYIRTANRTILTAVQIETPEAVANAEAIAAVDGIDALFIGPNDLALTLLGYVPARWDEVPFLEAIEKVRQAGAKHGKHVGILARNAAHAKELADNDWTWVAIGTDVRALQEAMANNIAIARGKK